ncbi:MAG: hypothetical protein QF415_03545 [Candidatus Undinarchaeales archaeon]|jgi:hypothetical protein|nr:hypothetical protein [Candidatus Undinarchaeales archaeon]MDP7493681.1 hypothetical protein [Candidatus Undinarchaeales archaeon]
MDEDGKGSNDDDGPVVVDDDERTDPGPVDTFSDLTTIYALYIISIMPAVYVPVFSVLVGAFGADYSLYLRGGIAGIIVMHGLIYSLLKAFIEDPDTYDQYKYHLTGAGVIVLIVITGAFGIEGIGIIAAGLFNAFLTLFILQLIHKVTGSHAVLLGFMFLGHLWVYRGVVAIIDDFLLMQGTSGLAHAINPVPLKPLMGSFAQDFLLVSITSVTLLGIQVGYVLRRDLAKAVPYGVAAGVLLAVLGQVLIVPSSDAITTTPLIIASYYYPDEPIVMEGTVSRNDGAPAEQTSVGAVIICIQSELGESGCQKGDIMCEVDVQCGMCECVSTDNWGVYKLAMKSPVDAGDYQMKLVVVDGDQRVSETSDFTVG